MATLATDLSPEIPVHFICEICHYTTSRIKDFNKHNLTQKHIINHLATSEIPKHTIMCQTCNKTYKDRTGLWRHNKLGKCTKLICSSECNDDIDITVTNDKNNIIMMILKQNADLIKEQSDIKQIILEIVKNGTNNNNTIHNNSHNKAFNLNFFLNDTCKNAMNITEFVDSIKLELSDLMELGEIGYVAGMSKIITKNLNALDETIRPIHCTDTKRETFYVKDEDKWEKEDVETKKLKKLIFRLSNKTYKLMPKYREMYPDYDSSTSTHSDEYCKIIIEAMMCDPAKDDKIIRNISKITAIAGK